MKILRSSLLEQANLDWTYSKLCRMKRYLFENSGIWRWPIFPMTPTVFQAWQTIVKRSMSKASSGVGEKVISRLKYSFTWKITFGEKLKTILFWGLHMTCHNFISSPLVHNRWKHWEVKRNLFRWLHFMSPVTTSGWRQCTTQLAWPPRWPSPQRWMKNNLMFVFNVFCSNL